MRSIKKTVIIAILSILSPVILGVIIGIFFVLIQMYNGIGFTDGFNSFLTIIKGLTPYFPYLTIIPVILIALILTLKNRSKIREKLKKRFES